MIGMSLLDYLGKNNSNDFTGFYGQSSASSYSLTTDSSGKFRLPTQSDVDAAEKPADKLKLLQQMADVINVQADAGMATGRANAVAEMTQSAKDMLASLKKVVDGLKSKDGTVAEGKADPALKDYKSAISGALTSLRNAMDKIGVLTSRTDSDTASQVASELGAMDDQASTLATASGSTWRRTGSTFRADPTKLVDILV